MTARIVLVRHGHVEGIAPPRFRGRADLPLTELGLRQAAAARDYVAATARPVAVYTSPLSRCMRTGEIIAEPFGLTTKSTAQFIDMDYGSWQGRSFDEVRATDAARLDVWLHSPTMAEIPGCESLHGVAARVAAVLRMILSQHADDQILLVGHDTVNRVLLLHALGLPLSRYWHIGQDPCAISLLEHGDGGWTAHSVNETGHLLGIA
jgi:phosphoserine phosphatase